MRQQFKLQKRGNQQKNDFIGLLLQSDYPFFVEMAVFEERRRQHRLIFGGLFFSTEFEEAE